MLLIEAERIGEETVLPRLLFVGAAEEEIKQAFGGNAAGRENDGARQRSCGNKRRAAPHAQKSQLCTQRQLHPTQQTR